jgi:hypothetical protein
MKNPLQPRSQWITLIQPLDALHNKNCAWNRVGRMSFYLNQTEHYHKNDLKNLKWEVTVCNCMEPRTSPVRQVLAKNCTYGEQLVDYLFHFIPQKQCKRIMEVGGGYGFVMRDLLRNVPGVKATMVDISPAMITFQQQTLDAFDIRFIHSDFFDIDPKVIREQDLVVMNEIVGDFPTACGITRASAACSNLDNATADKISEYVKQGIITLPQDEPFNLNIGAMMALDRVCSCHVPCIFLSEHSCEATVTDQMSALFKLTPSGNPEEIRLIGHSEYTIRFSDLERLARFHGYTVMRGNYTDFIKVEFSDRVRRIIKSRSQKDSDEIIRHFIEDLYIYEYLLLIKE